MQSWPLSDRLTLRAGGRYAWEERDGAQRFELLIEPDIRFAPEVAFFPNAVTDQRGEAEPDPFGFVVAPVNGPTSFEAFTPKIGLDFTPSDDLLLYATIQRGFKSGGYNIGSSQLDPFEPEKIWSYELGLKGTFLDGALDIASAAFLYDYTNLQAQDSVANQPIIRNVGAAQVLGFEIEALARLGSGFRVEANATYLDATFTEGELTESLRPAPVDQPPGSLVRDLDGLRLPRAPEWKLGGALQWNGDTANGGEVLARLSYVWQSEVFFTIFNIEAASEPSYGLIDARLGLHHAEWALVCRSLWQEPQQRDLLHKSDSDRDGIRRRIRWAARSATHLRCRNRVQFLGEPSKGTIVTPKQVTEEVFTAFGEGDVDRIMRSLHDRVRIEFYGPEVIPYAGFYNGQDDGRRFFETVLSSVDIHQFDPEDFICEGDKVVVTGHLNLTARSTGRTIDSDFVHVITVADEKWLLFRDFMNTANAQNAFASQ